MNNRTLKLRRKKEKAYNDHNYEQLYRICMDLAQIFLDSEKFEDALKEYKEAEQAGEMGGVKMLVAKAKRMLGEVYILLQQPNEAIRNVLKYLELSRLEGDLKEEQRALATLARIYFIQAEILESSEGRKTALMEAEKYNIKSLHVCERLKENTSQKDIAEMKARVYLNLGLVMEAQDRTNKAVEYLEKAVGICRSLDLWEELCLCYTNLGIAYKHCGNTSSALKAFDLGVTVAARLPDKAKSTCDILVHKAQVLFELPDFRGAKHAFHKAYKLRTPEDKDHLEIERKLKIVAAMCKLEERLVRIDESDLLERRKIYESMGDGCALMESYRKSLEYYHLALKCAKDLGENGKKLADIYVSLAQTYKDLKEFDEALNYYQQEFLIWKSNPAEASKTSISIADILAAKGAPAIEVTSMLKSARCLARDAKNLKLERSVLKEFVRYLETVNDSSQLSSILQELESIEAKLGIVDGSDSDSDSEKECDNLESTIGDDICLELLTDSELDEDETTVKPRTARRTNKSFHLRRNEKGETPLHTACINGNLSLVQRLLDQGHPVDVRDNNGWLPLHEAANYGYVGIVRELIERGAAINDRGGPSCGGFTPLLDAASCGNLEVMQLLLDKGASPTMRTNKGETLLDCLVDWRSRYRIEEHRDLEGEMLKQYNSMVHNVKAAMEKAGHKPSSTVPFSSQIMNRGVKMKSNKTSSWTGESLSNYEAPKKKADSGLRRSTEDGSRSNKTDHRKYSGDAVNEYEEAIRGVKHRPTRKEVPVSPLKDSHDPLLLPEKVVDDWLIDDLGDNEALQPTKRRRRSEFIGQKLRNCEQPSSSRTPTSITLRSSSSSETEDNDTESRSPVSIIINSDNSSEPLEDRRHQNQTQNRLEDSLPDFEDIEHVENDNNVPHNSISQKPRKRQTTLLTAGISKRRVTSDWSVEKEEEEDIRLPETITHSASSSLSNLQTGIGSRRTVKVLVEGKLLLVVLPNDPQLTMSWLAEEAARRYKSMEGVEPHLSLKTVEGALLFPQDPLSLIFDLGSEIHATVTSWNLIPIPQLYKEACAAANIDVNMQVDAQLDACQATSCFILEDCILTSVELKPVFKALSHYHALQHIRMSGNGFGDADLKVLTDAMVRFQRLRELDISCNNITSDGFLFMSQQVSQNGGFQGLEVLDVSFNPLGDNCIHSLSILMPCATSLHTLRMSSVSLTSFGTSPEFSLERIEELDISYNKIGQEGTRNFLSIVNPDRICSLNLAAAGKFAVREVAIFLSQCIPYNLAYLNLSYCDIDNSDMAPLLESLKLCPQLQKLNLAGNKDLSKATINQLLQLPLTELNLAGATSYQPLISSIANLHISSNSNWGDAAPYSFCTNNLKSLLSN